MKIRFKFRTLLIFIAFIGTLVAIQLHIASLAQQFVDEIRQPTTENRQRLLHDTGSEVELTYLWGPGDNVRGKASVAPLSFSDVLLFRRRCEVTFATAYLLQDVLIEREYKHVYRLSYCGESCESEFVYTSILAVKPAW